MKRDGKTVVIDNFWLSYQLYIDALAKDFEGSIIHDLAEIDRLTIEWPDIVIFLSLSEQGIRDFIKRGAREFDQSEDFIQNQALPIHKLHDVFFSREDIKERVISVPRDKLDFADEKDFKGLVEKIDSFKN